MREFGKNLLLISISVLICLLCGEAVYRLALRIPIFQLTDFRLDHVIKDTLSDASEYDPVLGWRLKSGIKGNEFNTIEYGIRRNRAGDDHVRQGGVLVVGASFTAGSEVNDDEAWPAQLETLIGQPVVNGAIGGFGVDQIVLRAEQLIPLVKPRVVVADLVRDNIATAGYSFSGQPKPYFTVENGALTPHNLPVPTFKPSGSDWDRVKSFLGYSLLAHHAMANAFPDFWFSSEKQKFVRAGNDEVEASCELIRRLKNETTEQGIRLILAMQYGYQFVTDADEPSADVLLLRDCVRAMDLSFIDEFDDLRALARNDIEKLRSYYVRQDSGLYGHKTKLGNLKVAEAVRSALAKAPSISPQAHSPLPAEAGKTAEVVELLSSADEFESLSVSPAGVTVAPVGDTSASVPYHRLSASDGPGEHYLVINQLPTGRGGQFVAAIEVRPETAFTAVRLQLLNGQNIGVYGDFDIARKTSTVERLGIGRQIGGKLEALPDGWIRIWVTANLPPASPHGSMIVQLLGQGGNSSFAPEGEALGIRAVTLTAGRNTPPDRVSKATPSFTELIGAAEKLENLALSPVFVKLQAMDVAAPKDVRYQLTATGGNGEHYLVISRLPTAGGQYVVAVELRPDSASRLRLQLFDDKTNGVIGDFDFARKTRTNHRLGAGREMRAGVEPLEDGWVRAWVAVTLPADAGAGTMVIQLLDPEGKSNFTPAAEAVAVRGVQLTQAK